MTGDPLLADLLRARLREAAHLAERTKKALVLVIQQCPVDDGAAVQVPPVRESIANVLAFLGS